MGGGGGGCNVWEVSGVVTTAKLSPSPALNKMGFFCERQREPVNIRSITWWFFFISSGFQTHHFFVPCIFAPASSDDGCTCRKFVLD